MATPYVAISLDEVGSTQDVATEQLVDSTLPVLIVAWRWLSPSGPQSRRYPGSTSP